VRRLLERIAHRAGVLAYFENRMRRGLTVLMYHRVLTVDEAKNYPLPGLVMPELAFRHQMEQLASRCEVVPVGEALERLEAKGRRDRLVAVTFDDGYLDNHEVAAPILDRLGIRATFFVTTGFIQGGGPLWFDRAARLFERARHRPGGGTSPGLRTLLDVPTAKAWVTRLKDLDPAARREAMAEVESRLGPGEDSGAYRPMTAEQLHALADRGHEVASHTVTHPILTQLDPDRIAAELTEARATLEEWVGRRVVGLGYPNGSHDDRVVKAAVAAGHAYACTVDPGIHTSGGDRMRIPRIDVTPESVLGAAGEPEDHAFLALISRFRHTIQRLAGR
jgi:peptidoglycan/xylan/chitin deacetylase (PgdA/CDA1 family)